MSRHACRYPVLGFKVIPIPLPVRWDIDEQGNRIYREPGTPEYAEATFEYVLLKKNK